MICREIHGFCAAVPVVRIHLPPAESHQRTELGEFHPREGGFPNGQLTQLWERPFDPSYSSRCRWGATHRCNRRPPASVSGSRGRLAQRRSRRRHQSAGLADPFVDSNAVLLARRVPSVGHEGLVTEGRKRRANQRSREISLSASSGPGRTPR